ncbi:MAG: hypothetical protein HY306_12975 [Nitrosomonadales bacterium]|nr:hypothetical protein [Nitrosomonadales bacterium]
MPHLLVDISAHGYGHVAQTAPVVNALAQRVGDLRVTLRSAAPRALLQQRFQCDFEHIPVELDFGMKMVNAVEVDMALSAAAYRDYHADWHARVRQAAQEMRALRADLLLANVSYLSLAAAHAVGVRAVAMCCLNWADIYSHYCMSDAAGATIHAQMLAAYNSAELFLRVEPAMPMPDLDKARTIGPIAQVGRNRREEIFAKYPAGRGNRLILVAMGGIEFRLPMEQWPHIEGVGWLLPQAWNIERDDMIPFESLDLPFGDLLASCDAVLTKPGYGTFVEASCAGVPVLYVSRDDWPEQPCLVRWLERNNVCREVPRERLHSGDIAQVLGDLWAQARPPAPVAGGAQQAARVLAGMLHE